MSEDDWVRRLGVAVLVALAALPATARAGKPRWQTLPLPPAMPRPDAEGTVESAGAQIFYSIYGKGQPVVLLHGGLGHSGHFAFQLPALLDRFQVIAIDSRAQGRSTNGSVAITYDQMAADVVAVLDQLAIARASIVGWSDGGEVALKLGIAFPDRVERLFVFAANYDASGSKPRSHRTRTFAQYTARCRNDYERLHKPGLPYAGLVTALLPLWRNPTGITRDQLRAIRAPVMMADGDHDEVIALDHIQEMATLIPHAQLTVFRDASHFALWQDPADFNRALVDFLTARAVPAAASAPPGEPGQPVEPGRSREPGGPGGPTEAAPHDGVDSRAVRSGPLDKP